MPHHFVCVETFTLHGLTLHVASPHNSDTTPFHCSQPVLEHFSLRARTYVHWLRGAQRNGRARVGLLVGLERLRGRMMSLEGGAAVAAYCLRLGFRAVSASPLTGKRGSDPEGESLLRLRCPLCGAPFATSRCPCSHFAGSWRRRARRSPCPQRRARGSTRVESPGQAACHSEIAPRKGATFES